MCVEWDVKPDYAILCFCVLVSLRDVSQSAKKDMSCGVDHHISGREYFGSLYVCFAESAKFRQHDSVATVGDADMKLGR